MLRVMMRWWMLATLLLAVAAPAASAGAPTVVSLTFDDGWADQQAALPYLNAHSMKGTFVVNSGLVGNSGIMSWDQLRSLQAAGHEIGGHTITHADLTQLDSASKRHEICDDRATLVAQGFDARSFAYPFGKWDYEASSIMRDCGYSSGRLAGGAGCDTCDKAETIPPVDRYATRSIDSVFYTWPLDQIKNYVIAAENNGGGWVQLVFHHICSDCDSYRITEADFAALLDWLAPRAATGTTVKLVRDVITPPAAGAITTAITSPAAGSTVSGSVKVSATASGPSPIAQVRFYVDGVLLGTDASAPYSVQWNTKKAAKGSHTLTAVAADGAQNTGTSAPVTVTI